VNSYGHLQRRHRRDTHLAMRCPDCDAIAYVPNVALSRHTRPRCPRCGALVVACEAARQRLAARMSTAYGACGELSRAPRRDRPVVLASLVQVGDCRVWRLLRGCPYCGLRHEHRTARSLLSDPRSWLGPVDAPCGTRSYTLVEATDADGPGGAA
jgi:ribosomal protein S27AE